MRYMHAHSASSHDERYAYASGRIRALEMSLLDRQRLDRLAEAGDLDEVLRLLSDTAYAAHLDEIEQAGHEVFIRGEEQRLLDLVDSLSLDQEVSDVLRKRYDFHNLKVAVREKVSERDLGHLYIDLGRFDPENDVRKPVRADNLEKIPGPLALAAASALEAYAKSNDPAEADLEIDRSMFAHFLAAVRGYGGVYMEAMVRTWIDLANIRTFMRARYLGLEARALSGMFFDGGFVRISDFRETFSLQLDEVLGRFEFSPYKRILEVGGAALERGDSFSRMEREIDTYQISFLELARYFTFGLEVVLAYAVLKQVELRVLRLILAAKQSGMPAERIKERIPDGQ